MAVWIFMSFSIFIKVIWVSYLYSLLLSLTCWQSFNIELYIINLTWKHYAIFLFNIPPLWPFRSIMVHPLFFHSFFSLLILFALVSFLFLQTSSHDKIWIHAVCSAQNLFLEISMSLSVSPISIVCTIIIFLERPGTDNQWKKLVFNPPMSKWIKAWCTYTMEYYSVI